MLAVVRSTLCSRGPCSHNSSGKKLGECLTKHNLSWNGPNGFTAVLLSYWADHNTAPTNAAAPQQGSATDELAFNVLELILALFDDYVVATPAQHTVIALWTLATHVYDQFEYSPRLGLVSPTSGYGKTTLFKLLEQLASEPKLTKNATPAAIYRRLEHRPRTTYLLDEAENQGLLTDRVLRAVIDAGYERGGKHRPSWRRVSHLFSVCLCAQRRNARCAFIGIVALAYRQHAAWHAQEVIREERSRLFRRA